MIEKENPSFTLGIGAFELCGPRLNPWHSHYKTTSNSRFHSETDFRMKMIIAVPHNKAASFVNRILWDKVAWHKTV